MNVEIISEIVKGTTIIGAIAGIVILDSIALMNGINGTMFTLSMIAIAGLGGYEIKDILEIFRGGKGKKGCGC
jgi:hypothetical protein